MSEETKETLDPSVEKPKASWFWIKDSGGYPSVSITMLTISFWVTTLVYILSVVHKIGPVELRDFNVGASGAYFGLILTTYVARRFTDAKYGNPNVTPTPPAVGPARK